MCKFGMLITLPFILSGCVTATADDVLVCKSNTLTFVDQGDGTVTASTQMSVGGMLQTFTNKADISANIVQDSLTSEDHDFSWVNHVTITIVSVYDAPDYPPTILVDQNIRSYDRSLSFYSSMSGDMLVRYLSQGPVQLNFSITGSLPTNLSVINSEDAISDLCISLDATLN